MAVVEGAVHTHTTMECLDIAETLRFYHEMLGFSTAQHLAKAGLWHATNNHLTANIELPKVSAQSYWNYHAIAVPSGRVDAIYERVKQAADTYGLRELCAPEIESRYGIGTYGFALCDRNGNWWRIEDANGPFGTMTLPQRESPSLVPAGPISYVTLEVHDLAATHAFYRDVLGLEVSVRDGALHVPGHGAVNLIAVPVGDALLPQPVLNHHGLTLPDNEHERVRALNAELKTRSDEFGLLKVMNPSSQHGSYSFYFQDRDTNWWEIETLEGGLDPWSRACLPDGDKRLLAPDRGASTVRDYGVGQVPFAPPR
jgi:catechol 2,3-dioxygenase-like lactoylglutathione lyase family enzyme